MARNKVRGLARFRRLIRRMPDAVRGEIVTELYVTGRQMLAAVLARTPRKSGFLREGISQKVLPKSLRLQIGLLGRRNPSGDDRFYGRIQDLGRKAQIVTVQRRRRVAVKLSSGRTVNMLRVGSGRRKRPEDIVATYTVKVRAMAGKRFVTGRYPDLRRTLNENLRGLFTRAASSIAGGEE